MHNYGEEKVSDLLVNRHTTVSENVSQITLKFTGHFLAHTLFLGHVCYMKPAELQILVLLSLWTVIFSEGSSSLSVVITSNSTRKL